MVHDPGYQQARESFPGCPTCKAVGKKKGLLHWFVTLLNELQPNHLPGLRKFTVRQASVEEVKYSVRARSLTKLHTQFGTASDTSSWVNFSAVNAVHGSVGGGLVDELGTVFPPFSPTRPPQAVLKSTGHGISALRSCTIFPTDFIPLTPKVSPAFRLDTPNDKLELFASLAQRFPRIQELQFLRPMVGTCHGPPGPDIMSPPGRDLIV